MREPRNEHEASRLIQDEGFGRVGQAKPCEWRSPHRAAACFEDDDLRSMKGLSIAFLSAAAMIVLLLVGLAFVTFGPW